MQFISFILRLRSLTGWNQEQAFGKNKTQKLPIQKEIARRDEEVQKLGKRQLETIGDLLGMKISRIVLIMVAIFFTSLQAWAQSSPSKTLIIDGRIWNSWDTGVKYSSVAGFMDGSTAVGVISGSYSNLEALNIPGMNVGEISKALDDFYTDPKNIGISMVGAWQWIAKKSKGATLTELKEYADRLRKGTQAKVTR
jgi:hypothetical protein